SHQARGDCHLDRSVAGSTKPKSFAGETVGLQTNWTQAVTSHETVSASNQRHRYLAWRALEFAALANGSETLLAVYQAIRVPGQNRRGIGEVGGVGPCGPHFHRAPIGCGNKICPHREAKR